MASSPPLAERFVTAGANSALTELWPVPAFSYRDQNDTPFTRDALVGRVAVADFIFTTCTNVCPMMTARMVLLQRRLQDPKLRFVSFSVDPEHDTPQALAAYRARWRLDARWILLRTDSTLAAFAKDMRVVAEAQTDPKNPILHSSSFFLIDDRAVVRGVYDSNQDAELDRLARDVTALSRKVRTEPDRTQPRADANLLTALGCAGCHERTQLAPPLGGIIGRTVNLEGGAHVVADAAYVRRAITTPGAEVVAGYVPLMPSYAAVLSPSELDALVREVTALPAPAASDAPEPAAPSTVTDPICGMQVRVTADTPHAARDGKTVYFCSERCRDEYERRGAHP
jgi:protein SCO1/2